MDEHQTHEQKLAAALRDLLDQIDIKEYRDSIGHPAAHNHAFLRAQRIVDDFDLSHEIICKSLDDCGGEDLDKAAAQIFRDRLAREDARRAKPTDKPVDYQTWRTGP